MEPPQQQLGRDREATENRTVSFTVSDPADTLEAALRIDAACSLLAHGLLGDADLEVVAAGAIRLLERAQLFLRRAA